MQSLILHSLVDVRVEIDATNKEAIPVRPGSHFSYAIRLTNVGDRSLEWSDLHPLNVSYRWLDEDGEVVEREGRRTPMPMERLLPHERHEVEVRGEAPHDAGLYQLQVSLVLEGVHWACDVSPSGWSTVALQLTPAPAWPEALRGSVGGRAIRGAIIASEFNRLIDQQSFASKPLTSAVDQLGSLGSKEPSVERDARKQRPWREMVGEWLRGVLGVTTLQHQVDEVLAFAGRQEEAGRELKTQIVALREELALTAEVSRKGVPEFGPNLFRGGPKPVRSAPRLPDVR